MKYGYTLIFLIGFIVGALLMSGNGITGFVVSDSSSPSNWVSEEDIVVFRDSVVLNIANVTLSSYGDTGSMEPLFDENSNGIRIVPENSEDIDVGDIVSFRSLGRLVVHRVVEKGEDGDGVYYVVKGDANVIDDGRIRFGDIEYVTIGVLW